MKPASMITENTRLCWPAAAYFATMPCTIASSPSDKPFPVAFAGDHKIMLQYTPRLSLSSGQWGR